MVVDSVVVIDVDSFKHFCFKVEDEMDEISKEEFKKLEEKLGETEES